MAEQPVITIKKPSKTTKPQEGELSLDNLFQIPADETPDDIAIDNLLNDFKASESAEVRINRVMPNNKLSYICTVHPSEFRFDDLRDIYEGGNFRLFVYGVDEDGRKQLRSAKQISVEKPKQQIQPQIAPPNNDMMAIAQMMANGFNELGKLIIQNQPQPVTPIDPIAMQNGFINQMLAMKQLFANPNPVAQTEPQSAVEKSLEMLTKGIELGKSMGEVRGETSATDLLLETVKSFGPAIGSALSQAPVIPANIPHAIVAPPPLPTIPLAETNHENLTENQDMNFIKQMRLKAGLNFLVEAAKKDGDITLYADLALDNMGDEDINAFFNAENPLNDFIKIEPKINEHLEWFTRLINEMKSMLTADEDTSNNGVGEIITDTQSDNEINDTDKLNTLQNT